MVKRLSLPFLLSLLSLALVACGSPALMGTRTVTLVADGQTRKLATEAHTVRDLLEKTAITLDADDRVVPAEPTLIEDGMTVNVIRVETRTETEAREVPFDRRTVRDASISGDETQLLEPGVTGIEELTFRVTLEDGVEADRSLVRRVTVREPRTEVLLIGAQVEREPVAITGTIAYIADHNAWVIRRTSTNQRRLTYEGDLDGRVFSLSGDGSHLLYTRAGSESSDQPEAEGTPDRGPGPIQDTPGDFEPDRWRRPLDDLVGSGKWSENDELADGLVESGPDAPFNTLWVLDAAAVDAEPVRLEVDNVLWAAWEPGCDVSNGNGGCRIAFTTGRKAAGNPGWRAENDLWIARPRPSTGELVANRQVIEPTGGGSYGWWGTSYSWAPGAQGLAYGRADEVGVIRAYDGRQKVLAQFPPYRTYAPWVWAPGVDWSPEGAFVVATLHGQPVASESPEDSPVFDVWTLKADGTISAELSSEAGMWAEPRFAPDNRGIAFGRARTPYTSQISGYDLLVMDRDGSNAHVIFPAQEEIGLRYPEMEWGPGASWIVAVYEGNLVLIQLPSGGVRQLTDAGGVTAVQWEAGEATPVTSDAAPSAPVGSDGG
jgi:hypothetical protein